MKKIIPRCQKQSGNAALISRLVSNFVRFKIAWNIISKNISTVWGGAAWRRGSIFASHPVSPFLILRISKKCQRNFTRQSNSTAFDFVTGQRLDNGLLTLWVKALAFSIKNVAILRSTMLLMRVKIDHITNKNIPDWTNYPVSSSWWTPEVVERRWSAPPSSFQSWTHRPRCRATRSSWTLEIWEKSHFLGLNLINLQILFPSNKAQCKPFQNYFVFWLSFGPRPWQAGLVLQVFF